LDWVVACDPKPLIVVDSLVSLHGGDENDATETRAYRAGNLVAARLITSDPMRYGGEDALAVRWARAVVRHSPRDEEAGPLFKQGRA
jgi:hypothetical protein